MRYINYEKKYSVYASTVQKHMNITLYRFTYHSEIKERYKALVSLPSTFRRRRSDLSMAYDKRRKEHLSTDGRSLGVKVNIKTKILHCFTKVADTIKSDISTLLR
jgi:hypothetical protein